MGTPYIFNGNKSYLVLTDNLTSLMAGVIDSILLSGSNITIVTSHKETQEAIAQNVGLPSFLIPIPASNDNKLFFNDNMPGNIDGMEFESFPLWKGLSIDRLRFWQVNNGLLNEFISKINYDIAVIDFDLMSPLSSVWESANDDKQVIVVKNKTFRTPEHFAFLKRNANRSIHAVITDKEMDVPYLEQALDKSTVRVWTTEKPFQPPIEKQYGEIAIYYDKQCIWQFNEYVERFGYAQPISFDSRSIEMFSKCHPNMKGKSVLPPNTVKTPSKLVMFMYDEEVIDAINPKQVVLFDPYGVNQMKVMSVGVEVEIVS